MRIFYDAVPDQIWIEGQPRSFARRSLVASLETGDRVGIRMLIAAADDLLISTAFRNISDRDGNPFPTQEAAKVYLDGEFAKARRNNTLVIAMDARVTLGGHRVVRPDAAGYAAYASADERDAAGAVAGITASAVEPGASVEVVIAGEMIEPSWAWNTGPVWLGLAGGLTQDPPAAGVDQQIGIAIAPTRLIVDIAPAIFLAQ